MRGVRIRGGKERVREGTHRREHDDKRDSPLQREPGRRRTERLVARPERAEGQDALTPEFLVDAALRELCARSAAAGWDAVGWGAHEYGEDVPDGAERDENADGLLGARAEHVTHEERGDEPVRGEDVLLRDRCELVRVVSGGIHIVPQCSDARRQLQSEQSIRGNIQSGAAHCLRGYTIQR